MLEKVGDQTPALALSDLVPLLATTVLDVCVCLHRHLLFGKGTDFACWTYRTSVYRHTRLCI